MVIGRWIDVLVLPWSVAEPAADLGIGGGFMMGGGVGIAMVPGGNLRLIWGSGVMDCGWLALSSSLAVTCG